MRTCRYSNAQSLTRQSTSRIAGIADDSNRLKFKNKYTIVVVDCINPLRMRYMPSSSTYILMQVDISITSSYIHRACSQ